MGLEKKETPPAKTPAPEAPAQLPSPPAPQTPDPARAPGRSGPTTPSPSGSTIAVVPFAGAVHQGLLSACRPCHAAGGIAAATRLILDGNPGRDHLAARRLVDVGRPARSLLLTKATGTQHGGGASITSGSDVYVRLRQWIASGAPLQPPPAGGGVPSADAGRTRLLRPRAADRRPAPATTAAPDAPTHPVVAPATPPGAAAPSTATLDPPGARLPAAPSATALHRELARACLPCHREGAPGGNSRYRLDGDLNGI